MRESFCCFFIWKVDGMGSNLTSHPQTHNGVTFLKPQAGPVFPCMPQRTSLQHWATEAMLAPKKQKMCGNCTPPHTHSPAPLLIT